jgi:phospholipid transport system transporter-binding protein
MFQPTHTLTFNNAKPALEAGLRAIAEGQAAIDFAAVTTVDSAAVATMLAWQRAAHKRGSTLTFSNVPANLQSLIMLYGVDDLLYPAAPGGFKSEPRSDLLHH